MDRISLATLLFASDSNDADPVAKVNDKVISLYRCSSLLIEPAGSRNNAEDSVVIFVWGFWYLDQAGSEPNLHVVSTNFGVGAPVVCDWVLYRGTNPNGPKQSKSCQGKTDHPFNNQLTGKRNLAT